MVHDREAWRAAVHRTTESDMTESLNNNKCTQGVSMGSSERHDKTSETKYE